MNPKSLEAYKINFDDLDLIDIVREDKNFHALNAYQTKLVMNFYLGRPMNYGSICFICKKLDCENC